MITELLLWLEQAALSVWVRETPSLWAFPFVLFLHTLGLGVAAGFAVATNVCVLRLADAVPVAPLRAFWRLSWIGFAVAFLSGALLLAAYPAKALTDPVFYVKIGLICVALAQLWWIGTRLFSTGGAAPVRASAALRASAAAAIALWIGAVVAGRLLAYTYRYLSAADMAMVG